jgi:hypothetical protein
MSLNQVPVSYDFPIFKEYCENHGGFCVTCRGFTRHECEPDAVGYECPQCGGLTVMGAETAMISGHIEFKEDLDREESKQ